MSKKALTEGPWRVLGEDAVDGIECIEVASGEFGPGYKSIARVGNDPDGLSEEDFANARLIAAAPEMLEALEAAENLYLTGLLNAEPGQIEAVVSMRRAALSKATGGE